MTAVVIKQAGTALLGSCPCSLTSYPVLKYRAALCRSPMSSDTIAWMPHVIATPCGSCKLAYMRTSLRRADCEMLAARG